ncbi:MAG: FGGY family carbohydrate kinase [candidate division KSB1 bacterium]|nr:FGGY family carbohydrate kinase [candidate division KSB1 bacterium]
MSKLFAGLDVSTQSCKLVVIDFDQKEVTYVTAVNYDQDLPHYGTKDGVIQGQPEGVSEADPRMWLEAVDGVFERARQAGVPLHQVRCMSVSGQQHGLVALDENDQLARPTSKLWNDYSTAEECQILTEKVGGLQAMLEEVGNSQRPGYTAAKIFHMVRHEPENYRKSKTLFLVHNYINWYLTGGVKVMEPGDVSGMALWNPRTRQWSKKVVEAIAPDLWEKLPPVKPSDEPIGKISPQLVQRFGFSPDCLIDAGSGDNMYGAVATGNVEPGIVTISLGTSGTAYTVLHEPYVDPTGEIALFCDSTGKYLPLLCVSNMANGYNELLRVYGLTHEEFTKLVEKTPPGNGGRLLVPWYMGERTPDLPWATAIYFGFGLDDFTPEYLARAVLEGHVLNMVDGFQKMPVKTKEIRLTGGLTRSHAWCQMIADIFEAETVPVEGEGAALGAALHAAWVWHKSNGQPMPIREVVQPFLKFDESRRKRPRPEFREVYRKQKALFHAVSARIRGLQAEDPFKLRREILSL